MFNETENQQTPLPLPTTQKKNTVHNLIFYNGDKIFNIAMPLKNVINALTSKMSAFKYGYESAIINGL